jgi:hypothetical protein
VRTVEISPPDVAACGVVWTHAAADLGAVALQLTQLRQETHCRIPSLQGAIDGFVDEWARYMRQEAQAANGVAGSLRSAAAQYQHIEDANAAAFSQPLPAPGLSPGPDTATPPAGGAAS